MAAISDSSPLILYARVGRLDLLRALYGEIHVPPAVWHEVVGPSVGRPGAGAVRDSGWIRRRLPPPFPPAPAVAALDPGEAEAIHLAASLRPSAPLIILDDGRARRVAGALGLVVTGSGGVLASAKQAGLISAARPILADLRAAGLYLSRAAELEIIDAAGE